MELEGVRLDDDVSGSASLSLGSLEQGLGVLVGGAIEDRLHRAVEVLGLRVLDREGRELRLREVVVIVGFGPGGTENEARVLRSQKPSSRTSTREVR